VNRFFAVALGLQLFVLGEHFVFVWSENQVHAPQYGHGQHDTTVLWGAVRAAEFVGDTPNEADKFIVVLVQRICPQLLKIIAGKLCVTSVDYHSKYGMSERPHRRLVVDLCICSKHSFLLKKRLAVYWHFRLNPDTGTA
jgi:hypothetical protein